MSCIHDLGWPRWQLLPLWAMPRSAMQAGAPFGVWPMQSVPGDMSQAQHDNMIQHGNQVMIFYEYL